MLGRTHMALGLLTALVTILLLGEILALGDFTAIALIVSLLGALLPDLDMGTSSLASKFGILKSKHIKKIWIFILSILSIMTIVFLRNTPIFHGVALILFLGFIFADKFAKKGYYKIRNFVQGVVAICIIIGAYYYKHYPLVWIGVILFILLFSGHRRFSHSLVFLIGCTLAVRRISLFYHYRDYSPFFGVSMASHIIGDMMTKAGVAFFSPFTDRRIRFPFTIKTGSWVENGIFLGACLAIFQLLKSLNI